MPTGFRIRRGRMTRKQWNRGLRRRRGGKKMNVTRSLTIRGPQAVPDETRVKLAYVDIGTLDAPAGGALAKRTFRGNSIFDPDESLGGGQPMGFDQWAAFYNRYQVTGCSIDLMYLPRPNQPTPSNVHLMVVPTDESTSLSGIAQAHELPYSKYSLVPGTQAGRPIRIRHYLSTKKKFGYDDIAQEDDLSSLVTDNPIEQWFWQIAVGSAGGTAMLGDVTVKFTYYVRFFDRKDLQRS